MPRKYIQQWDLRLYVFSMGQFDILQGKCLLKCSNVNSKNLHQYMTVVRDTLKEHLRKINTQKYVSNWDNILEANRIGQKNCLRIRLELAQDVSSGKNSLARSRCCSLYKTLVFPLCEFYSKALYSSSDLFTISLTKTSKDYERHVIWTAVA